MTRTQIDHAIRLAKKLIEASERRNPKIKFATLNEEDALRDLRDYVKGLS